MADVADKWTCPRCQATWIRDTQSLVEWFNRLGRVQVAHEKRCAKSVSLR